jgi:hypothetical protein
MEVNDHLHASVALHPRTSNNIKEHSLRYPLWVGPRAGLSIVEQKESFASYENLTHKQLPHMRQKQFFSHMWHFGIFFITEHHVR